MIDFVHLARIMSSVREIVQRRGAKHHQNGPWNIEEYSDGSCTYEFKENENGEVRSVRQEH